MFQAYAVSAVIAGTWTRPAAYPEEAYLALMYPDMFFIPFYLAAAILLLRGHYPGRIFGLLAGGAVVYVMIYLLALSGLHGVINLSFDSAFLVADGIALVQIVKFDPSKERSSPVNRKMASPSVIG